MTQPCHKDTTLNQQCCDNGHTRGVGGESNRTQFTPTHNTHPAIHNTHRPPHLTLQHTTHKTEEEQDNTREQNNMKGRTPSGDGALQHTPRHSTQPPSKQQRGHQHWTKGTPTHRRGTPTFNGEASNTATLHSPCHPPPQRHPTIHDGPTLHHREGGRGRGYPTTRTPQTHTHHPHTTHLARNSARHDSSTRQHCNVMSRARATPPHRAAQQQHTPPPFHTPRRMDVIHSSTHLLSLVHVHTTNERS